MFNSSGMQFDEYLYYNSRGNGILKTTIQQELDKFFLRTCKFFFSEKATDITGYLTKLATVPISSEMTAKVISNIVNGKLIMTQQKSDFDIDSLEMFILQAKNPEYMFHFLQKLIECSKDINDELGKQIIKLCFDLCLRNFDFQKVLLDGAIEVLKSLCNNRPVHIGSILMETCQNFDDYEDIIFSVYEQLPLQSWYPKSAEVYVLGSMLKDPLTCKKSLLARYVVDQIPWETSNPDDSSKFISIECQKQLCLTITNIYLDFAGRLNAGSLFYAAPLKLYSISKELTQKLTRLQFKKDADVEFKEWCWKILVSLQIYSIPESPNSYPLSIDPTWSGPFESVDSPTLSTIKSQLNSYSLAAFSMLLLSEIGHDVVLFNATGWTMLKLILEKRDFVGLFKCSFEIFQTFTLKDIGSVFGTEQFTLLFASFWSTITEVDVQSLVPLMKSLLERNHYSIYSIKFFASVCFTLPDWKNCRECLYILDALSTTVLSYVNVRQLLTEMNLEYKKMMFKNSQSTQIAVRSPIDFIIGRFLKPRPSSIEFPSLFAKASSSIFGGKNELLPYHNLYGYMFTALSVELFAEKDIRIQAGEQFLKRSFNSYMEKPKKEFVIIKFFELAKEFPLNSPLAPLMWQIFFNLYFERVRGPGVYVNQCFGYLFLQDEMVLLDRITAHLKLASVDESISQEFRIFYNSAYLWLITPNLLKIDDTLGIGEEFLPILLKSCISGELIEMGSNSWWIDIINPSIETPPAPILSSASVTIEEYFPSPEKIPLLELNEPIVGKMHNVENVKKILEQELNVIKSQGRYHSAFVEEYSEQERVFLELLSKLYNKVSTKSNIFKKCGSNCQGVSIEYQRTESVMDTAISQDLTRIKAQLDSFRNAEYVDLRTVLVHLRILEIINRWKNDENHSAEIETARDFFYQCIELLNIKLNAFPPAEIILTNVVTELGKSFIMNSENEMLKIYEIMKKDTDISFIHEIFDPNLFPQHLELVYKGLATVLKGEDAYCIFSKFDVLNWQKKLKPSVKHIEEFILNTLKSLELMMQDNVACKAHRKIFRDLVRICPLTLLPRIAAEIFPLIISDRISSVVLKDFLSGFMELDFDFDLGNATYILVASRTSKSDIIDILNVIRKVFVDSSKVDLKIFQSFLVSSEVELTIFLTILFSSNSLYLHTDDIFLEELVGALISLFKELFGLSESSSDALLAIDQFKAYSELEISLVEKLCKFYKWYSDAK
jgi:hypothetical protein